MKNLPVYKHPASYAREHDELAAYRASNQANAACKEAIEAAIRDHYRDNRLDAAAVDQVVQQFGYRKAGYSKKFLAEHESEITIHKAAKNYFDGLGFKKLPTIKALNTEYAELLAEKKAAYADYRKAREEMKELLTAKANIDRILEVDKEQEEANERREKEAEQR